MFHIILHEPEIPPNTGSVVRLCANTGCTLHLIRPLGFSINAKALRRAGLDYREAMVLETHDTLEHCYEHLSIPDERAVFACSTHGRSSHADTRYPAGAALLFGSESRGLPETVRTDARITSCIRLPMVAGSRSLNLSNAVAVVTYEAWRQHAFAGS